MLPWFDRRSRTRTTRSWGENVRRTVDETQWYVQGAREALFALVNGERTLDARSWARLWGAMAEWLILGGVLVVPVAAVCAAIGAVAPGATPLRQHTGTIFAFAMLWFVSALLAVQFQRRRVHDRAVD